VATPLAKITAQTHGWQVGSVELYVDMLLCTINLFKDMKHFYMLAVLYNLSQRSLPLLNILQREASWQSMQLPGRRKAQAYPIKQHKNI